MGSSKPPKQEVIDPAYSLALQAQYNRVGQSGPGGSARYTRGPGGNTEIQTQLNPMMQRLMGERASRALARSSNQSVDPRINQLAGLLAQRVGGRFGMEFGADPFQLAAPPPTREDIIWENAAELPPDRIQIPPQRNYRGG